MDPPSFRLPVPGALRDSTVYIEDAAEASTLLNRGSFGEPRPGGGLSLSVMESIYLAETGRLSVASGDRTVPLRELFHRGQSKDPTFEVRYLVYRDLRQRGYVVKEAPDPLDFRVYPRGGAPKRTPSKYGVLVFSERSAFDLDALGEHVRRAAGARKNLLLAVVDEESDLTYYAVREATPRGRAPVVAMPASGTAHLLEDRATVLDEDEAVRLHHEGNYGRIVGRRLQLSLLETVFLLKSGAAVVRSADTERPVSLATITKQARSSQPDFDLRLRVYEDLRSRGMVPKTGFKYGSHFRAYEGDPDRVHAKYLVHATPAGYRGTWPEVSRAIRLAHGVKKDLLLASVGKDVTYLRMARIRP